MNFNGLTYECKLLFNLMGHVHGVPKLNKQVMPEIAYSWEFSICDTIVYIKDDVKIKLRIFKARA